MYPLNGYILNASKIIIYAQLNNILFENLPTARFILFEDFAAM